MSKLKMRTSEICCISYGICIFLSVLGQSYFGSINIIINYFCKVLLGFSLTSSFLILFLYGINRNKKMLFLYSIFAALLVISIVFNAASTDLFYIAYFMYLCYFCEPEKVLKFYFYAALLALVTVLLCWRVGILESLDSNGRLNLGFYYTTFGANVFLHICLALVAWKKKNMRAWHWIIILTANYWFNIMTKTTAVYLSVWILFGLYVILHVLNRKKELIINRYFGILIMYFSFIAASFTIVFVAIYAKLYEYPFFISLNRLLSMRLSLTIQALQRYPITLFGQPISWVTGIATQSLNNTYFYVDSSYMQILLQYGIFMLIVVCICFSITGRYSVKTNDVYLILAIIVFLLHCITDPQLLSFRYDPFLIITASSFYKSRKMNQSKKLKLEYE